MFAVMQNKRACKYPFFKVHPSFENNQFGNFNDAVAYANLWLGSFGPLPEGYTAGQKFAFEGPQGSAFLEIVDLPLNQPSVTNPPFETLGNNEQVRMNQ